MNQVVELRCPLDHWRMFGKLLFDPQEPPEIVEGMFWEFACDRCARRWKPAKMQVLHRFNAAGEYVETKLVQLLP